jgi:hypothetical protein
VHDSSFSGPTAVSARCEATLELGRKLTKELGLDQSVDTLGRWMAHYIAELIQVAETANGEERPAKMRACCEVILSLWRHRHQLPNGKRPFEELEPILKALGSLEPDDTTRRYFSFVRAAADEAEEEGETKSWLKLVEELDYSARALIRYCLSQAAQAAVNKSAEWVALAESAGAAEELEVRVIGFLGDEKDPVKKPDPNKAVRQELQRRIDRLENFTKMAEELISDLWGRIRELPEVE